MQQENIKTVTVAIVKTQQQGREVFELYQDTELTARFVPMGYRPGYWLVDAGFYHVWDSSKGVGSFVPYIVLDDASMVSEFLRAMAQGDIPSKAKCYEREQARLDAERKAQAEFDAFEEEFLARQW